MQPNSNKLLYLLILCALYAARTESRLLPQFSSFSKEQTYLEKRILLSSSPDMVTENDSFLYAVCDSQEKTFKENKCNVTMETPAFSNASYKEMCSLTIVPEDSKRQSLTKLFLYPFTDDKVLLTWTVKDLDWHTKMIQVRILYMSNCKFHDVSVLSDKLFSIVPYENTFDVVVQAFNKATCGSDYCKITYNAEGKVVNGPSQFLPGVKLTRVAAVLTAAPRSPMKGFYTLALTGSNEHDSLRLFQAATDGKGGELLKTGSPSNVKLSNTNELFSVCWTSENTNVTCKQYDAKMIVKFNAVFEFHDSNSGGKRWIRPHNLHDGGLLLLTGVSSGKDNRRFDSFSVVKIGPTGFKERPLEVEELDFECLSASELFVNISEEDNDEFCFHFVCERSDFDRKGIRNVLKFATKCMPRRHISVAKHRASLLN